MAKDRVGTLFEGDASDLIQEVGKVNVRVQKLQDQFKGVGQETKKLTQEEKAFGRETKRAFDEIRGPQQRHEQRTRALHALLKRGKITQEEFNAALRRTKEGYQNAGRAGQQAFGPQTLSQIKGMVTGYLSLGVAIGITTRALQDQAQVREELAQRQRALRDPYGKLQQVATSPADYLYLKTKAKEFYAAGAAPGEPGAAETVFQLRSAGQLKTQFDLFKQVGSSRLFPRPGEISAAAAALSASLGEKETGDLRAILSKSLAASQVAPATAEAILTKSAESGGVAKTLGISDEELLAAVAVSSKAAKGAELGGTRIKRLLISLEEAGLKEGALLERLETVKAGGGVAVGSPYRKFFGRELGRQGYADIVANVELYRGALKDIRGAERKDLVGLRTGFYKEDPQAVAGLELEEAEAEKNLAGERLGVARNRFAAMVARGEAAALKKGDEWGAMLSRWVGWGAELFAGPEALTSREGAADFAYRHMHRVPGPIGEAGELVRTAESLRDSAASLREVAGSLAGLARQQPVTQSE